MRQHTETLRVETTHQGLVECTAQIESVLHTCGIRQGLCTILIAHTSASLTIQENADPSARYDLETFLNRLIPENDPHYTHTAEGPDDMPAHIKAALTSTTLSIPILNNRLALGVWQGIYVWEHRHRGSQRKLVVHILGD